MTRIALLSASPRRRRPVCSPLLEALEQRVLCAATPLAPGLAVGIDGGSTTGSYIVTGGPGSWTLDFQSFTLTEGALTVHAGVTLRITGDLSLLTSAFVIERGANVIWEGSSLTAEAAAVIDLKGMLTWNRGNLTIQGDLATITDSLLRISGTLIFRAGTLSLQAAAVYQHNCTLRNLGVIDWQGGSLASNVDIHNERTGTINWRGGDLSISRVIINNGQINWFGGVWDAQYEFISHGILNLRAGRVSVGLNFQNYRIFNQYGGAFSVGGSFHNAGSLSITGGSMDVTGIGSLGVTDTGRIMLLGGTLRVRDLYSYGTFYQYGGDFAVGSGFTNFGRLCMYGGSMSALGMGLHNAAGASIKLYGGSLHVANLNNFGGIAPGRSGFVVDHFENHGLVSNWLLCQPTRLWGWAGMSR